ncbi:MAG TPA: MG2 domain-containing protein, partial [Candidatus Methylomirabilis sp.]|nr:MG2 domain-containing protein [Candidatus Methylomirabilis sp.]
MGKSTQRHFMGISTSIGMSWFLLWLLLVVPAALAAESADPRVIQFTPQGTVKQVRQVSARFSEPMVPLGDPRGGASSPFEIACPEPGTGRWVDSRTWAYDFARDLPAGVRCTFRVAAGLASLTGKAVVGQQAFAFSTGGPAIRASTPREGNEAIEEDQAFLLVLDAEPTEASLLQNVSFSVEGIPERIGVKLITGKARQEIIQARYRDPIPEHILVLQARQRFPNGAKVNLVWGKAVVSQSGVSNDQDQVLPFKTRQPFTALFSCERENRQAGCIPVTPMRIQFSSSVAWEQASRILLVGPGGRRFTPEDQKDKTTFVRGVVFAGPFPESSAFQVELPDGLVDDAGRPLANASQFPLSVKTDPFPPLAKFSARFGIIEWKADPALPVTLRNLEPEVRARLLRVDREERPGVAEKIQDWIERLKGKVVRISPEQIKDILPWLRKVAVSRRDASVFAGESGRPPKDFVLPKPLGAEAFEVVGIPLTAPGLYIVELESARLGASLLGRPQPMYVPTAALVTNLAVHFKWGRETSLAWVTTLDAGRPVPQATITLQDCQGTTRWTGETDQDGIARIGKLPTRRSLPRCLDSPANWEDYPQTTALRALSQGLLVTAQSAGDLSFVHSSWSQGIEPWRFRLPSESYTGPIAAHTIFDRPLFRAGETVHMKHLIRKQTLSGFSAVPEVQRPTLLSIRHLGSDQKYEFPLQWDGSGLAESTWSIPLDAKLGNYEVVLLRPTASGKEAG